MTTFAAQQDHQAELDARRSAAWTTYRDELCDLGPDAYAEAEPPAWDQLQERLAEVEALRSGATPSAD